MLAIAFPDIIHGITGENPASLPILVSGKHSAATLIQFQPSAPRRYLLQLRQDVETMSQG
jgi:hypothetical protein